MLDRCIHGIMALNRQLQDSTLHPPSDGPAQEQLAALVAQLTAGCRLATSCSALPRLTGVPAQEWQRIAQAAYSLLHGSGFCLLELHCTLAAGNTYSGATEPMLAALLAQLQVAVAFAHGRPLQQQLEAGLLQADRLRAWLSAALRLLHLLGRSGEPGKDWTDPTCKASVRLLIVLQSLQLLVYWGYFWG